MPIDVVSDNGIGLAKWKLTLRRIRDRYSWFLFVYWHSDVLKRSKLAERTYLSPHHFCEGSNELRRCVDAKLESLFVDDFANGEPEGGLQTLSWLLATILGKVYGIVTSSRALFSLSLMVKVVRS